MTAPKTAVVPVSFSVMLVKKVWVLLSFKVWPKTPNTYTIIPISKAKLITAFTIPKLPLFCNLIYIHLSSAVYNRLYHLYSKYPFINIVLQKFRVSRREIEKFCNKNRGVLCKLVLLECENLLRSGKKEIVTIKK